MNRPPEPIAPVPSALRRRVAFCLGANLGDARGALRDAVAAIEALPGTTGVRHSAVYRTAPWGGVEQPDFLNLVVIADTDLGPRELLAAAMQVEAEHHRTREVHWGPRTLDVDVLALGDLVSDDPDILLPHPRAHERAFVLVPWAEVDPDAVIVGRGAVAEVLAALPRSEGDVRRADEP